MAAATLGVQPCSGVSQVLCFGKEDGSKHKVKDRNLCNATSQ